MAKIEIIITDMGNGGAFCSHCGYCLDNGDPQKTLPVVCPKCKESFDGSSTYVNQGGSDF